MTELRVRRRAMCDRALVTSHGLDVCSAHTYAVNEQGTGDQHTRPVEHRDRIFEPFHRLRPLDRGAGLGLNLVQEIVRLHGGRVSVVDRPGGACIRMTLPLSQPEA